MKLPTTPRARRLRRTPLAAGLSVLLSAASSAAQAPAVDKPRLRWEYFHQQRAYPDDRIPPGALQRALGVYRARWPEATIARAPAAVRAAQAADPTIWTALGPAPIATRDAGRISSIALHPTQPGVIYIGAAQGGVWRTNNGGQTWVSLTDRECSLAMGSLAIDPINPNIIYAGTGELHFSGDSYYGCGVLRSADAGDTWTRFGGSVFDTNSGGARISKVLVDRPTAGSTITTTVFLASNFGVYRSLDSGATWTRLLDGIATDLVVDPAQPRTLYTAIGSTAGGSTNGIYKSTDAGDTWIKLTSGLPIVDNGRVSLTIAPSQPSVLYAAFQNAFDNPRQQLDGQLLGIWKTTDAGSTWVKLTATGASCGTQCWYDLVIAAHPTNPDIVIFGGVFIYRSTNGGDAFQNVLNGTHVDHHALAFDPRDPTVVYSGNDGGIFRSTNGGTLWASANGNLAITQFYSGIALHPADANVVLGGTQDNGTLEFQGVPSWEQVMGADGGFTAIDFNDPNFAYAETQWGENSGFSGPRRRDAPGSFNTRKVAGIDLADRALFIPPLVMDPVDPTVLYFGTFRVYRTSDRADLWSAISPDLTRTSTGRISAIAAAAADRNFIYAGTNDGHVQVTENGGTAWDVRIGGLANRAVTDIAVDAVDPRVAIVSVSGFGSGHVFRTTDAGRDWQDISGNLPDMPVNAVLTDPNFGASIYIGTDLGVFRSDDLGGTWTPFNDNLPNVAVFDLGYSRTTGLLVAATHGRGMFAVAPVVAARVAISRDSVSFGSVGDTARLDATATNANGDPLMQFRPTWRSLDARVATVDAEGLVRSAGNGATAVIAAVAGKADTALVRVRQIVAAVTGLPDTASFVAGEARQLSAVPVDAKGQLVADAALSWTTSDPTIAAVDGLGRLVALRAGATTVTAAAGGLRDTTALRVAPPAIVALDVASAAAGTASSAVGTRLTLLRLRFTVDGIEAVRITRLGFDAEGDDPNARIVITHDVDGDGVIDGNEPELGAAEVALRAGAPARVIVSPPALVAPVEQPLSVLLAVRMSGAAPNGSTFRASFVPTETRSVGVRSSAADRITQPASVVASAAVQSTVLGAGQVFSMSENPIRSRTVTFNFSAAPEVAGIYTLSGRLVVDLTDRMSSDLRVAWDLTNTEGAAVGPGVYLVVFEVEGRRIREKVIIMRSSEEEAAPLADRLSAK